MRYETRQFANALLWIPTAVALLVIVLLVSTDAVAPALIVLALVVLTALTFAQLRVTVADDALVLRFGPGWIRRSIPLERIAEVSVVESPWWYGWGIRWTPRGWLWNVAGPDAVELLYGDGGRFRVGTADPEGLARAIRTSQGAAGS